MQLTYITGNPHKAERFQRLIGREIAHQALDLSEIQSLELREIVEDKAYRAFAMLNRPIIVEDTALTFHALGKLPGPFIKWFLESLSSAELCRLIPAEDRRATVTVMFCYFDGKTCHTFLQETAGEVPKTPRGDSGFGWDSIFIPEGYTVTRAEMSPEESDMNYAQMKPFGALRTFLDSPHD